MKILLLEDDFILNEIIEEYLQDKGHQVTKVFDGKEAEDLIYSQTFDLLLLDVNVPNIDGISLLKNLRINNIKVAAIFITSANMLEDMKKGFDAGCDDYIKKPFELKELDLRINNIKRIYNLESNSLINIDKNIVLDKANLLIENEEKSFHLALKECEVLEYLFKNRSHTVSIEELSLNVWAYEEAPQDSTIRTYIKNLRKILGEDKIINTRGVGYRLNTK